MRVKAEALVIELAGASTFSIILQVYVAPKPDSSMMKSMSALFVVLFVSLSVGLFHRETRRGPDQEIVARINREYLITFSDLSKYVNDRLYLVRYPDTSRAYETALDEMIVAQLKRIDFFESGLQQDDGLIGSIRRTINEELVLEYFQTKYQEKYINEESIQAEYENMRKRVIYRQIVLYKPRNASSDAIDSLKVQVTSIRNLIDAGEDFGDLVRRFSQEPNAARTGGFGEPVTWRKSLLNPRDFVILNLNAGDVRTIETRDTYQIVQIERIEPVVVDPIGQVRSEIIDVLRTRHLRTAVDEFEREKRDAVDSISVVWDGEGLAHVVEWSNLPGSFTGAGGDSLAQAVADGRDFTILDHSTGHVDAAELLRLLTDVLTLNVSGLNETEDIKAFILEAIRTEVIAGRARALGLEEKLLQANTASTVLRDRIVRLYDRRFIEERLPVAGDQALRSFFEEHRDSLFRQQATVNVYVIIRSDKAETDALRDSVEQGVPFEKLADSWLVKSFVRNEKGEIRSYLSQEEPYLGEVAFELEEGEVRGPVAFDHQEEGRQYALLKLAASRPKKTLTYEEIEGRIADVFTEYHRSRIRAAVEEELRARYPVTVYHDVLDRHLSRLRTK